MPGLLYLGSYKISVVDVAGEFCCEIGMTNFGLLLEIHLLLI